MTAPTTHDPVAHIPPFLLDNLEGVAADAVREVQRQDDLARAGKFGGTHILPGGPNDARLRVLVEEVGEVAKELNEIDMGNASPGQLYDELVQTAACAIAWGAAILEREEGLRDA